MRVEVIESKINKKDAKKQILSKMPLMSRVSQFNSIATDFHLEYIELKVLSYEVITKKKGNKIFRQNTKIEKITMLINTYNGYSQSIEDIPTTVIKYISKSCIKKSKIKEEDMIEGVKSQIIYFLKDKMEEDSLDKINLQNINVIEIRSIYKPYWIANFKGKNILIDANTK